MTALKLKAQHAVPDADAPAIAEAAVPRLEARFVGVDEARALVPAWRGLFRACVEANPFFGPDFLLPLLKRDDRLGGIRFLVVAPSPAKDVALTALWPILPGRSPMPGLSRVIKAVAHPFIFNSLPLLRQGCEAPACVAMISALEAEYGNAVLAVSASPLDAPAATALLRALDESKRSSFVIKRQERAGIVALGTPFAYLERIKPKTKGKFRRYRRDLSKLGPVDFRAVEAGPTLADAVQAFIRLEAAGWKGRQGSAFASDPRSLAFAREALASGGDAPATRVELLTLAAQPVGASLHLVSEGYSVTFKIAYDETYSRQAPGVLALFDALGALLEKPWTRRLDSGVSPDDAAGAIWRDRFPTGEILIATSPGRRGTALRLHARLGAAKEKIKARMRDLFYAASGRKRTLKRSAKD